MARQAVRIAPFEPRLAPDFARLNRDWIERLFRLEAADLEVLEDPQTAIIDEGGQILFALDGDTPVGTVAAIPLGQRRYELAKMAVAPSHQGRGLGEELGRAIVEWVKTRGGESVILLTNSSLGPAIRLYERLGFVHRPLPDHTDYARADVYMELELGARGAHLGGPMQVRPSLPQDRDHLLELWERSVRATHRFLTDKDISGLRPLVAQELAGDSIAWWVLVTSDNVPIGFMGYTPNTVEALFIDPDQIGKGGGRLLIEQAQRLAGGELSVDVNEQNDEARGFYERLGFRVVGRSPTDSGGRPFPLLHLKRAGPDRDPPP
jgi:putative acetyltransferase